MALDRKDQKMTTKQQVTDLAKIVLGLANQVEELTNQVKNDQPTKAKKSRKTAARATKAPAKKQVTRWFKQGKNGKWTETKDGSRVQFQKDKEALVPLAMFNSKTGELKAWNSDGDVSLPV